jgi:hypothetical protein
VVVASFVFGASVGSAVAMTRCQTAEQRGAVAVSALASPFAAADLPPAPPTPDLPDVKPDAAPPLAPDGGLPDAGLPFDTELLPDAGVEIDAELFDALPLTARASKKAVRR